MIIDTHSQLGVLASPVACIDRRTLSQAWYSALYGRDSAIPQVSKAASKPPCHRSVKALPPQRAAESAQRASSSHAAAVRPRRDGTSAAPCAERRMQLTPLAKRMERTLRRAPAISKAALAIDASGARVQLLFRSSGSRLHVVAICSVKSQ